MNNRRYADVLLTLCLIAVAVIGCALVSALDRTRFELENLHATVRSLQEKISSAPLQSVSVSPGAVAPKPAVPMANAEFFDPAAESGDRYISSIAADTKNMNYLINTPRSDRS